MKIKLSKLLLNSGQIDGLPKNPRFIKDDRYDKLKQSLIDAPEMTNYRGLLVFPHGEKYVTIGGNMRLRAARELGWKEIECIVIPEDTPVEKLREYTIKDNVAFGSDDWDSIANEWDEFELEQWGIEIPAIEEPKEPKPDYTIKVTLEDEGNYNEAMNDIEELIQTKFPMAKVQ